MTTTRFTLDTPCHLCGGTIGSGIDGAHCLCAARQRSGVKIVCLGHACTHCLGRGWWRADGGPPAGAALPVYSNWICWTICQHCKGTGKEG